MFHVISETTFCLTFESDTDGSDSSRRYTGTWKKDVRWSTFRRHTVTGMLFRRPWMFWHVWKAAAVIVGTNPGSHLSLKRMTELVALCRRGKYYSNIAVQCLHFHINTDFWLFRFFREWIEARRKQNAISSVIRFPDSFRLSQLLLFTHDKTSPGAWALK